MTKQELRDEWMMYHAELYQPGSPINTMTIFDWWMDKLEKQKKELLDLVEKEVEKKVFEIVGYRKDFEVTEVIAKEDISTIFNQLRV